MAQVFLSYARDDVGRAKSLAAAIERAGYSVWWDRDLEGGAEYSLEIDEALKAAAVVVVMWSKASVGSAWVRDEAAAGRDSGRLVPVRLDGVEPPLGFRQYQTIDLSRWNGRSDSAGLKTLKRAIAAKTGSKPAADSSDEPPLKVLGPNMFRVAWVAGLIIFVAGLAAYLVIGEKRDADLPSVAIVAAEGTAQSLARNLAVEIGGLKATTANSFELRDVASGQKDINYLVEVSSDRQGQAAVADLTLTSRDDPQILWTGHYRQDDGDQAALQQQAATRLAALLNCLGEARPPSGAELEDDRTLRLYLQGCTRMEDVLGGSVESELISLFRQVTERAPQFAPAWANLAFLESNAVPPGRPDSERAIEDEARKHLARARALNPKLGIIYLTEADLLGYHQWEKRLPILDEGIRQDPDFAALHTSKSIDLRQIGRLNEAADSALRAAKLDPLSPRVQASVVPVLASLGRTGEALQHLEQAERRWPGTPVVLDARYAFEMRYGDAEKALAMFRGGTIRPLSINSSTGIPNPAVELFLEARVDPTPAKINAAIDAYLNRYRKDPSDFDLQAFVTFGKLDMAYQILEHPRALQTMTQASGLLFRIHMRPFRHDPRFMMLAARLGLVRYWTQTGKWPDFCFEPDLPYDCKREAARLVTAGKAR